MKKLLWFLSALFFSLTIYFYYNSVKSVGYGSSRMEVANVQMTVFAAASAVLCGINFVGAILATIIENTKETDKDIDEQPEKHEEQTDDLEEKEYSNSVAEDSLILDPSWKTDDPNWLICPVCEQKSPVSYIQNFEKCPKCGRKAYIKSKSLPN